MITLIVLLGLVQVPTSASEELARFLNEWDGAYAEMSRTREAVRDDAQLRAWNDDNQRQTHDFGRRALDLAARHPGTTEAVDALSWIVALGYGPENGLALAALRRDHATSPRLGAACNNTRRSVYSAFEEAEAFLRAVVAANPDRAVRGQACFALAIFVQFQAEAIRNCAADPKTLAFLGQAIGAERLARFRGRDAAALTHEAGELFERVRAEFADLKDRRGRLLGTRAEGELTELRSLQVGLAAPEIVGRDVDGREFRLSEFKGRVVALTFAGNWCGPCRAAYPRERELVKRLKGQPFALVSVNTDEDPKVLRQAIDSGEITWRCWSEAGVDGPTPRAWGVSQFPMVYVLDASGLIRFRNVEGDNLDKAVDALLAELKPAG